ncbi:LuxR C-terminal-related transcriptional regulator [Arsenophonus nasoniae]|uniref:LuxR C-terminal-related transcriptional regulator n=1 Tax=Arsenophonus nasoniae TaxID=638 RepID=A0AA95K1G6_9GAMM|nr:LuxR C-terminal-related transcriptional regulator [Arsenophonus nasoniae]WGL96644.1 LuxR C-terminal-related transcriptional regulator [Arsenophonus nasoniae]
MISLLLVEDNEFIRLGMQSIFDKTKGMKIAGHVVSLNQAIQWCRKHTVEIILLNGRTSDYELIKKLQSLIRMIPDIGIIMYSTEKKNIYLMKALEAGARGILSVKAKESDLLHAIRVVKLKQKYLSPDIAQWLVLHQLETEMSNPLNLLSDRELQIMLMVTRGVPVGEIAKQLNLNTKTINSYRYRMFSKLKVRSDVELTHIAITNGLIQTESFYYSA